ncbi:MAG: efflux RND transporter permease subunit [Pseudomonadota bacterium]
MNGMISWWAKNTVAANLLMLLILVAGILSFSTMRRETWPSVQVSWVRINMAWPGAAPQEVEEQLVQRIEESIKDIEFVDRLQSSAQEGRAEVMVQANTKAEINDFINDIKVQLDGINTFPRDAERPIISSVYSRDEVIRLAVHGNVPETDLRDMADQIRDEVALLPSVELIELFGARDREVSIELSETSMRQYGVTFDQVAQAVRASSLNRSSGRVRTENGDISLRAVNLADTAEEFSKIVVRQNADGGIVRLGDIASVNDGFVEDELLATLNGEPAVLVQVMSGPNTDVVKISQAVSEWLPKRQARMPEGMSVTMWWDSSKVYKDRVETIGSSAFYGLILVFLVLILTLRPKVAMWVTIGIATAFAGAFILLPANGVTLNMLSLFAFLLVLGVVVDDAIVVGENIHHQGQIDGKGGLDAAILGTQLVAKPVIYAVLTTMVAFAPWLFLSGDTVQFTRQISIIIVASLSFSLVEALLILPAHLSKMKPRTDLGRFGRLQKRIADSIVTFANGPYRRLVTAAVKSRYLTASLFIGFFIISVGFLSSGILKFNFMPEVEDEQISVSVELPDGTPYSRALQILDQLQRAEKKLVAEVDARSEDGKGRLIENWYTRSRTDSVLALVQLAPPEVRDMSAKQAADRLRELIGEIPDAKNIEVGYTINGGGADFEFSVNAADLDTLRAAVADFKRQLETYDGVFDVRDNLESAADEIQLSLKPGAETLGVNLDTVSQQVRQAYFGEEIQRLPRDGQDVRVMLRYPRESRQRIQSLSDFRVRMEDGREVPLMQVADITYKPGLKRINRRERQRSAVVSASLRDDNRVLITRDLEENFFKGWEAKFPGVTRGAIGEAEGEAQFLKEVQSLYFIAFFIMYMLIAVAFKSYALPLLVMTAIPFGFMGAVFGHVTMGISMALFSYFGIGAAAGVVVNDNLVLVDYLNRLRAKGMDGVSAVIEAGVGRFRPILLTSVTTFIGLVPMLLERSTQAQFLKPAVVSLGFGVLLATFVTLLLVPALYVIGMDLNRAGSWTKRTSKRALRWWLGRPSPKPSSVSPREPAE